jgi:phage gpG-like protein
MSIRVSFNTTDLKGMLARMRGGLRDTRAAWLMAATIYYKHVGRVFREEGFPDKWVPLAASTLRRRRKGKNKRNPQARILQDTGMLRKSATGPNSPGSYLEIHSMMMIIGSTLIYAGTHNYGHKQVPARPFLTITSEVASAMSREWMVTFYRRTRR